MYQFPTKRRSLFLGLTAVIVFGGCRWTGLDSGSSSQNSMVNEALRFNLAEISGNVWRVPDVSLKGGEMPETLSMRREAAAEGSLLIRSAITGLTFLYDRESREMRLATQEKWDSSTDDVTECTGPSVGLGDMERQPKYKAVLWKYKTDLPIQLEVDITGRHQWGDFIPSPSLKKLAVFSYDGKFKPQNFIFGTTQQIRGDRYIDFFEMVRQPNPSSSNSEDRKAQLRSVFRPTVIRDPTESVSLHPCWTRDEQFLVMPDDGTPWLWIVDNSG